MEILLHRLVHDAGSVVVFEGTVSDENDPGRIVTVTVDHRIAQDLAFMIDTGDTPLVDAEDWQVSSI
jgi:molybdopterin synthase catalytic subunit